jgi:hypothetical protein
MANQEFSFREIVVLVQVAIAERKSAEDLRHPDFSISEITTIQAVEIYTWIETASGKFDGYSYEQIDSIIDIVRKLRQTSEDYGSGNLRIL